MYQIRLNYDYICLANNDCRPNWR